MRIAHLVGIFPTLSETFILNQIVGQLDRGIQVDIFSQQVGDTSILHPDVLRYGLLERTRYIDPPRNKLVRALKGIALIATHLPKHPRPILGALNIRAHGKRAVSLKMLFSAIPFLSGYDVIHCHYGSNGNLGVLLRALGIRGKLITTFHGYDIRFGLKHGGEAYRRLFEEGDCFIAISRYNYESLLRLGLDERKIVYHPVGIDLRKFPYRESGGARNGKVIRLITVARLVEEKGLEYGIRAVNRFVQQHPELTVRYDIVGGGPLHNQLSSLIQAVGLESVVRLLGPMSQPQVLQSLRESEVFLLPSVAEVLPVVLMECQAVGLPVIASRTGSVDEIVLEGKSGFLVPPGDARALAERLEYLAAHPALWTQMAMAGRKHVEENFDVSKLNDRLVGIYEDVLSEERMARGRLKRVEMTTRSLGARS